MQSSAHRVVLGCAIVLAVVSAGGAVQVGGSAQGTASRVELLDPGSAPRMLLRLTPTPGTEQATTLHQEQTLRVTVDGQTIAPPVPATEIDLRETVRSVGTHRISSVTRYEAVRVLSDPSVDAATRSSMSQVLGAFTGKSVSCVRTDTGQVVTCSQPHIDFPASFKALGDAMLKSLGNQLPALAMPFPEQPVGVGARWRFTPEAQISGLRLTTVSELLITRIDGRHVEATMTQTVTFVPGPATVNGVKANVESGSLAGSGTIAWDLDRIQPTSVLTIEGTTVMTAGDGSGATRIEQFQRQVMRISERTS